MMRVPSFKSLEETILIHPFLNIRIIHSPLSPLFVKIHHIISYSSPLMIIIDLTFVFWIYDFGLKIVGENVPLDSMERR
jgi:hypothetical protein